MYPAPMENLAERARELEEKGLVKLEGWVQRGDVHAAREMVMQLAREHGLLVGNNWMRSQSRFGLPKAFRNALNDLNRSPMLPPLLGDDLRGLIEGLVGQSVTPLPPGQQILFTLPREGDWAVPRDAWHIDLPKFGERTSPGLQAFTFLGDVAPKAGATLVIAGSHRLENDRAGLSSKELMRRLRAEAYFGSLLDAARPPIIDLGETTGRAGDVALEVVELTGLVGDVYLMDLRVLHTPAPNCSDRARMMLTCRFPTTTIVSGFTAFGLDA